MDFRFAVCDDAPEAARFAAALCCQWAVSRGFAVLVDVFQSAQALLFENAACLDYDVLILDIRMEGQSGLDLARQVRLVNRRVQIVFVTGYLAYVEKGYDVEALHYLIKPVCAEKLFSVLDRAVEKLQKKPGGAVSETQGRRGACAACANPIFGSAPKLCYRPCRRGLYD